MNNKDQEGEVEITKEVLANLLKDAEEAHARYEEELGEEDPDWHLWYAEYILEQFDEMSR